MSTLELLIIATLTVYAVYKQTKLHVVTGPGRFKLALTYGIVGVVLGLTMPHSGAAIGLLVASLVLSGVVGLARGACTRVWRNPDGQIMSQGTATTITLFLALIASKFALGAVGYQLGIHHSSMGEILLMIAVSVAIQAEVVWRRAQLLAAGRPTEVLLGAG